MIALTGLFLLSLIVFLRYAQAFVLPVVLAVLLHFLLRPVVISLARWHLRRPVGAALVLAIFIGGIGTALSTLQEPAKEWLSKTPESLRNLENKAREFVRRVELFARPKERIGDSTEPPVEKSREPEIKRFNLADALLSSTALIYTASFLTGCLETVVVLYFLLASGDVLLRRLVQVLPNPHDKQEAEKIVNEVQHNISAFLLTISIINACIGLLVALTMRLLGLPNPVLWGVVAGLFNFIPYFGPLTVFIVLVLAGFLSFEAAGRALLPALLYLGIHALESNIVTPAILGRRLTLSPLIIFVSLMFWTWLWGMPGALLAVPLLMAFKILCDHFKPLAPIGEVLGG